MQSEKKTQGYSPEQKGISQGQFLSDEKKYQDKYHYHPDHGGYVLQNGHVLFFLGRLYVRSVICNFSISYGLANRRASECFLKGDINHFV